MCSVVATVTCEHHESISRNHDTRRGRHPIERTAVGVNLSAVAGDNGVDPIVVHVAIEDFQPLSRARKAYLITPPGRIIQAGDDDDVASNTFEPPMKGNHAAHIMNVVDMNHFAPQRGLMAAERDEIGGESKVV